jgi:hypothetical protein
VEVIVLKAELRDYHIHNYYDQDHQNDTRADQFSYALLSLKTGGKHFLLPCLIFLLQTQWTLNLEFGGSSPTQVIKFR